jgi:hypothetical protein
MALSDIYCIGGMMQKGFFRRVWTARRQKHICSPQLFVQRIGDIPTGRSNRSYRVNFSVVYIRFCSFVRNASGLKKKIHNPFGCQLPNPPFDNALGKAEFICRAGLFLSGLGLECGGFPFWAPSNVNCSV